MGAAKSCDPLNHVPMNVSILPLYLPPCYCQILVLWSFLLIHQRFEHLTHGILLHPNLYLYVATHPKPSPLKFQHSHLQQASLLFFISLSPSHRLYLGPNEQTRVYNLPSQPLHGKWLCCHFMSNYFIS